ncbi:hypothetical protein EPA93_28600 [Ktedonosporobacter rubrisoli]|uniref:Lantibiotic dehydratase n=1 Tax=Ktedonosporobacter rubrisoli TaxID=2509675 RepID=A0A4P6JW02_KTERU|nr:lantibiotic dehydratase [Ktedonosporobacter rubrisoli]QBD79724.1 hypothetical protein EPA93_28600 [Ktedonosporobacter rubrisoli]
MPEKKQTVHQDTSALYVPAGFYMLRTPTLPADLFKRLVATAPAPPEKQEELEAWLQTSQEQCYQLLGELASQPQIALALALSSTALHEGLTRLRQDNLRSSRIRRTYSSLLRYLIRMCTRPTPFGLFSGVTLGNLAPSTTARLASPPIAQIRTRPDMEWLLALLQKVEEKREYVKQLRVSVNQTAYIAGERALLPLADAYGQQDNRTITLRATSVVRKVFALASTPQPYAELQAALHRAFPQATTQQVENLLWQLWENHFLLSDLHPPLTNAQPAEYIASYLSGLQETGELTQNLQAVLRAASALDSAGYCAPLQRVDELKQSLEVLNPTQKTIQVQVDTALQLRASELQQGIGELAAQAAELLLRLSPAPQGSTALQAYRMQFIDKYGERAEVPVLDLLSPENGLDAPSGYMQPPRAYPFPQQINRPETPQRDRILQLLLAEALNEHALEAELTPQLLQKLERWSPRLEQAPPSLEIYLQIHADSASALDHGQWHAVIGQNCGSPDAGRTFGRFYDLLEDKGMEALQQMVKREEALEPDVIFAELSYLPRNARGANVALRPALRSYEIVVGTTPSVPAERVISLHDLVVGVHNGRFYLRSLRLGKRVIVGQTHMLNSMTAPNVCRFILDIAQDARPGLAPFDWGDLNSAPFLPRVSFKTGPESSLVLSPAQWHLTTETIVPTGTGSDQARWFQGLQSWRARWRVPRYVYITQFDNRLLLDLDHPVMAEELRNELARLQGEAQIQLQELLPDFEHLWLQDEQEGRYFAEIVVPLLRSDALQTQSGTDHEKLEQFSPPTHALTRRERNVYPGEDWIFNKLYASPKQHDELIAGPVRSLIKQLQEQGLIDRWFYLRYNDPEPHLRLRCHASTPEKRGPALQQILQWSLQLAERGLLQRYSLDTYEREVERYGGPDAIELLEQVFTLDSTLTSNLVAAHYARHLTLDPMLTLVFSYEQFFAAWGYDQAQRLQWLQQLQTDKYAWSKEFRAQRKLYCEYFAPRSSASDPDQQKQRQLLLSLLQPYTASLRACGEQVRKLAQGGKLWVPEHELLGSLAHMHKIRFLDLDRQKELQAYAFWHHTLESLRLRPEKSKAAEQEVGIHESGASHEA